MFRHSFKRLFTDVDSKELLISFLNEVLGLKDEDVVRDFQILNTESVPETKDGKLVRFDLIVQTDTR